MDPNYIANRVALAIEEDVAQGDITAQLLSSEQIATASLITRESAVICGCAFVDEVYKQLDEQVKLIWHVQDGQEVHANQRLCYITGPVRSILTGERIALNFLQTLSATATTTAHYAAMIKQTKTTLLDTRKTIPGLRLAQKYAVTCGGGRNHRLGLFDAFLIKENHILACGSISNAILQARQQQPNKTIEIEVECLAELEQALAAQADIIMLDNFTLPLMKQAVEINQGRAKLEVSGNINEDQLVDIAATGIDFISVGALTKHIRAIDLSLRLISNIQ